MKNVWIVEAIWDYEGGIIKAVCDNKRAATVATAPMIKTICRPVSISSIMERNIKMAISAGLILSFYL